MSTTISRLPLSVPNMILIGGAFAGVIATVALRNWFGAGLLIFVGGGGLLSALLARRASASDWLRINAIEYRDERDSRLASHGFAVVGAWALALSTLELVAATIFVGAITLNSSGTITDGTVTFVTTSGLGVVAGALEAIASIQLFVLCLVWGIANTRAVKRG
ncbi:MAG: hypothetical protein ABIS08_00825 [Pseudolysinimonas sp.]